MAREAYRRTRRGARERSHLSFAPPRDAGVTLRSRGRRPSGGDPWVWPLIGTVAAFLAGGALLAGVGSAARPSRAFTPGAALASVATAIARFQGPSPVFATCGTLRLRLPVSAESVTAVAFHQASFREALPLVSLAPTVEASGARRAAAARRAGLEPTTGAVPTTASTPPDVWNGAVVRVWRSGRSGNPDTAVDVGARSGTPVLAPIDGTVVLVRPYRLYAKYDDLEVHIVPESDPGVDVVLIHISDVTVRVGDRVKAGRTQVASVRNLSSLTDLQLADYTTDGGDHTHVQVNRLPEPGSLWVSSPSGPVAVPFSVLASATPPAP